MKRITVCPLPLGFPISECFISAAVLIRLTELPHHHSSVLDPQVSLLLYITITQCFTCAPH